MPFDILDIIMNKSLGIVTLIPGGFLISKHQLLQTGLGKVHRRFCLHFIPWQKCADLSYIQKYWVILQIRE